MRTIRFCLIAACVIALACASTVVAQTSIATVDLAKVRKDAPQFKNAFSEIETMVEQFEKQRDRKRSELENLAEDFQQAQEGGLSGSAGRLRADLESRSGDFQEFMDETFGTDGIIESHSAELLTPLYENLAEAAKRVAKDKGLDLILDLEQVNPLFADKSLDVTDEVLAEFVKLR